MYIQKKKNKIRMIRLMGHVHRTTLSTTSTHFHQTKRYNHDPTCIELSTKDLNQSLPLPIPKDATIFSMIQPTGPIHLGNYLGALSMWKHCNDCKHPTQRTIFGVADLHALTVPDQKAQPLRLKDYRLQSVATLLSCGIDPERSIINFQSLVGGYHCKLMWILGCHMPMGYLNRMTQWKDKKQRQKSLKGQGEKLGLFAYPVLMAADIVLYKSTHVPVGDDQSQHLEMSRELVSKFNSFVGEGVFPLPKTLLCGFSKKIMSLSEPESKKMSKSSSNKMGVLFVNDEPGVIREKIKKAKTDSISDSFYYDKSNRPGVSNLIDIVSGIQRREIADVERDIAGFNNYVDFKNYVSEAIIEGLKGTRESYNEYMKNPEYLWDVVRKGSEKSAEIASKNLAQVERLIGLGNDFFCR